MVLKISSFGLELWKKKQVKIANNRYCCSPIWTSGSLKAQQRAGQFVYRQAFNINIHLLDHVGLWPIRSTLADS